MRLTNMLKPYENKAAHCNVGTPRIWLPVVVLLPILLLLHPSPVEAADLQPDESPPYTYGHDPVTGATNVDLSSDIVVHVADSSTGVYSATLAMTVGGVSVTPAVTGSLRGYALTYDPPTDFDTGEVVTVTVDGCDLAVPANCMDTEVYSFTVQTLPVIDVWYGSPQVFGHIGIPQQWVNILGNVSDPDGVASLAYSLNGGPETSLSIGPDTYRLAAEGDFNIDMAHTDLISGSNQVVIAATDIFDNTTVETVTVEYVSGNVWPETYSIDWSSAASIQDVAQVVDGLWTLEADSVRPVVIGYDRLVAIGDMTWDDYEATVPIIVHGIDSTPSNPPAVGILMRWEGHHDWYGWQPKVGWWPLGAIGMYRWYGDALGPRFQIYINNGAVRIDDTSGRELEFDVCYNFKVRVETIPGQGAGLYSFKVWENGESEPSGWDLTHQAVTGLENGSFLLFAHHVDASFGDVTVTPSPFDQVYTLTVNSDGNGSVTRDPDQTTYTCWQVVTLTAEPALGWSFAGWSGDLGTDITATVTITGNTTVTATFTQDEYTLTVNTDGDGSVTRDPDQTTYTYGQVVTLTAEPVLGWSFAGWSGDLGTDITATVTITGNTTVTATFTQDEYTLTVNTVGEGSVAVDPTPGPYHYGDVVTLTATADDGWKFSDWSGALSGSNNPATLTITGNEVVTATFTESPLSPRIFLPFVSTHTLSNSRSSAAVRTPLLTQRRCVHGDKSDVGKPRMPQL
jgi:uncharacterized repeat protein (TIGR02543 family)